MPRVSRLGDGTYPVYGVDELPIGAGPPVDPEAGEKIDLRPFAWHRIDQANQGSCCGAMGCGILMLLREFDGLIRDILSQACLYGQGNGGSDQGMAIDTCWRIIREVGTCPTSVIPQYDWQGFKRGTWPANWKTVAKKFRGLRFLDIPDIDAMDDANERGFPVGYGAKGHAVIQIPDGNEGIDIGSWGWDYGDNGLHHWTTRAERSAGIRTYGAWVAYLVTDPTNDGDV